MADGFGALSGIVGGLPGGIQAGFGMAQQAQIQQRLAAIQGIQTLGSIIQMPRDLRGPFLDAASQKLGTLFGTPQGMNPTILDALKKAGPDSSQMVAGMFHFMGTQGDETTQNMFQALMDRDPDKAFQLFIAGSQAQLQRERIHALQNITGTSGQTPIPSGGYPPGQLPSGTPSALPSATSQVSSSYGTTSQPLSPVAPPSELDQLNTIIANKEKVKMLAATLGPEGERVANLMDQDIRRLDERRRTLQGVGGVTANIDVGGVPTEMRFTAEGRPLGALGTATSTTPLQRGDITAALEEAGWTSNMPGYRAAYLNVAKQTQVQPGGAVVGAGQLVIPPAPTGRGSPVPPSAGSQPPLYERLAKPEPQEVAQVAQSETILQQLQDLIGQAKKLEGLQSTSGRAGLFMRNIGETQFGISALTPEERQFLAQFHLTRISFDRALTSGSSVFRSPTLVNLINQAFSSPTGAGVEDRLQAVYNLAKDELTNFQKTMKQSGRQFLGSSPGMSLDEFLRKYPQ